MDHNWETLKEDVNKKTLINQLDRSIKRRNRLFVAENEEDRQAIADFRKFYKRIKPIKLVAMALYIILPFFEKPAWCIKNSEIDMNTTEGFWFCQNELKTISNSHLPKLPASVTNGIYIFCLAFMFYFTKVRDRYRKRDKKGDTI
jgi:hypothetical protein